MNPGEKNFAEIIPLLKHFNEIAENLLKINFSPNILKNY